MTVDACVFDAYGTLFDFDAATVAARERLGDRAARVSEVWRAKQLQYTWLRTLQGAYVPFRQVTADALAHALDATGVRDPHVAPMLMAAYDRLPTFADVAPTLDQLAAHGVPIGILSNGDPDMLEAAVAANGLGDAFAAVLSAQSVQAFKTDPRVYDLARDRFGGDASRIAFVSANAWDAHGAAHYGFRAYWLNRAGLSADRLPGAPAQLTTLSHLPVARS